MKTLKGENADNIHEFQEAMLLAIEEHKPLYGDSWKEISRGKLFDRLKNKFEEFDLTCDKDKLISLCNLAMFLYIRMDEDN